MLIKNLPLVHLHSNVPNAEVDVLVKRFIGHWTRNVNRTTHFHKSMLFNSLLFNKYGLAAVTSRVSKHLLPILVGMARCFDLTLLFPKLEID